MHNARLTRGTIAAIAIVIVAAVPPASASGIVELPVEFTVKNVNRSLVPCPADGRTYTMRGHLVAPQGALIDPRAVALYVHGATLGEYNWRFKAVPGYDTLAEMAHLGHTSIAIDRLGFDASDHPVGSFVCIGSEADITSQIIEQLKTGAYMLDGEAGPAFGAVALIGYSAGGAIAEIVGHSFGNADALGVVTWVNQPTAVHARLAPRIALICATGGEGAEGPSSPTGYHYTWPSWDQQKVEAFGNAESSVLDALEPMINRDPCGYPMSLPPAMTLNNFLLPLITAPVLFVYADADLIAPRSALLPDDERVGSVDVTVATIADAGHTVMLQRTAPAFRSTLHAWLVAHGF